METQEATQRLYNSFGMDKVEKDLAKRAEQQGKLQSEVPIPPKPVDIYQRNQDRLYGVSQKSYPKGSSAIVNTAVNAVIDGMGGEGLARAYKRAKDDSDSLMERGERGRAELRRQQYMQEHFLPALEIVVNSTTPDEVLNSEKALAELDKYVLLSGNGAGKGYAATYIRQAYGNQLGQVKGRSDDYVRSGVRKINLLLDEGQVREALAIANNLKDKIDSGLALADDIDYELIGRVCAFYG